MSSFSKSDTPAAKVVMKVPTPDSLVEVKVSPPDSNFEVKVAPGEEIIALYIRPGSSSYVEIRITPPAGGAAADKSRITVIGNLAEEPPAPAAEEPLALETGAAAAAEEPEILEAETPAEEAEAPSPAGRPASPPDVTSFTEGIFTPIDDGQPGPDERPVFLKADSSGIPGPDPALFEGRTPGAGPRAASISAPIFTDPESSAEAATDYRPPEEDEEAAAPPFGIPDGPAKAALARLSAAVETEKAEMAANQVLWIPPEAPEPVFGGDDPADFEGRPVPAEKLLPARDPEASHGLRRIAPADATIMVQMYDDLETFNPAADTVTPLSEDEEMEIGPMDEELSLGPIDIDKLEESDLGGDRGTDPADERGLPRAKPLSTVVPGNTIIPSDDD